ncbi:LysR family transcriptional regulator [Nitrogeniibacter mangrovi]|uniref:LysR family transcriptional regulator n=1 Tax=Nitrogeniibacter mangrovi TaxID=2016596 RepID=A0A6C1B822_9RHOO|nr:LysR family transcriptional regulator [Nitrogeniibacter mangrovi]QID18470.1 LysR family transcriptional regulator [Nitrogeniibacter mangrovi]
MDALNDIAVFVQVVNSGSFTAAADKLGISKSVVSKYVTRLEDRLGARLLSRTTRRLSLTEVGRAFFERSRRGLQEIEDAEAEVSRLQGEPRGELRINSPMSFGILHIAPHLPAFQARYPELTVDMELDDRRVDLVDAGFDVAIRVGELPDSSLVARRLSPCRHVVCGTPEHFARHGVPRTPEELAGHPALVFRYHASPDEWRFVAPDGSYRKVALARSMRMNNSLALREAALAGAGVTLVPTFVVGADLRARRLQAVLTEYTAREVSIYAVYPQRKHLSPKIRAFVDFMAGQIQDPPHWDR